MHVGHGVLPRGARLHVLQMMTGGLGRELYSAFATWCNISREHHRAKQRSKQLKAHSIRHAKVALLLNPFFSWVNYMLRRVQQTVESDRGAVEVVLAVAELEAAWGSPLAAYPEPDSSATCDECGRSGRYRFYHFDDEVEGGIDFCERCWLDGEMASAMAEEVRAGFVLVAPQIEPADAWRDVANLEIEVTRMNFAERNAETGLMRSEAQLAARMLVTAASAASALRPAAVMRVTVVARFPFGGSVQVSVPIGSRAASLGARDAWLLGEAALDVMHQFKSAPSMMVMQHAIKTQLIDEPGFVAPEQYAKKSGLQRSLGGRSLRVEGAAATRRSTWRERERGGSVEVQFLLRQFSLVIGDMASEQLVQTEAELEGWPLALAVGAGSRAASLSPDELGAELLHATRNARSVTVARAALSSLLLADAHQGARVDH